MALCVEAVPVDGGRQALMVQAVADGTNPAQCAYVLQSGQEFQASTQATAWQELGNMSIENAEVIGAYVALIWGTMWGFKQIARAILNPNPEGE